MLKPTTQKTSTSINELEKTQEHWNKTPKSHAPKRNNNNNNDHTNLTATISKAQIALNFLKLKYHVSLLTHSLTPKEALPRQSERYQKRQFQRIFFFKKKRERKSLNGQEKKEKKQSH